MEKMDRPGVRSGSWKISGAGRLRILLIHDHLGWARQVHGITRLFEIWASYLPKDRYEVLVCILTPPSQLSRGLEERGVRTIFLPKGKHNPLTALAIARLIVRNRIDILHLQGYRGITFGKMAAKLTGVPTLIHFHDVTENYPLAQKLSDLFLGRCGDMYLAVSCSAQRCWAKRTHLPEKRIRVIYNCASTGEFREPSGNEIAEGRRRLGIPAGARVVGNITRLHPEKGTRYLIEAASKVCERFPDTFFVIAGDGPERSRLEMMVDSSGLRNRVRFLGSVEKVAPVLAAFDIHVLTSYTEAGSPLPVIEAMCMAKPVIATDLVEILEDGVTGILIPPKDPQMLAEKIVSVLSDPAFAAALGRSAKKAAERFDPLRYVLELGRIYDSLALSRVNL